MFRIISLLIFFITTNLFSQDLEYSEQVGNKYFDMNINYKVIDKKVYLQIKTKNLQDNGKGGVSVSFPEFKTNSRIIKSENVGFKSLKAYPKGSNLWNGRFKTTVKAKSLLVEGWATSWKKNEEKKINLEIDINKLSQIKINVRANLTSNKKEYVFPKSGVINEQSYASNPIIITLKKLQKKVQTQEKFFYGKNKTIEDKIFTSYEILPKNKIKLDVTFAPDKVSNGGGISISFPQLKDKERIIKKSSIGFKSIGIYKSDSKLWNGNIKKSIKSEYLLVEGWSKKWYKFDYKTISLIIDVKDLDKLKVNVRANFKYDDVYSGLKSEINIPNEGIKDQQDYFVKQLEIPTKKEDYKTDIYLKINEKHDSAILKFVVEYKDRYTITYAGNLKIWDRKTKKLVKKIEVNIDKMIIIGNKMFYINKQEFSYINLDLMTKKILWTFSNSIDGFSDIVKKGDYLILPIFLNNNLYADIGYFKFNLKNEKISQESLFTAYKFYAEVLNYNLSKDMSSLYLSIINNEDQKKKWYKLPKGYDAPAFWNGDNTLEIKNIKTNINDFLFTEPTTSIYENDYLKKNDFFQTKSIKSINQFKNRIYDIRKINTYSKKYKLQIDFNESSNMDLIYLINKETNKKTKLLETQNMPSSLGCYYNLFEDKKYENLIINQICELVIGYNKLYLVSKEGKFLSEFTSSMVKFDNNYFNIKNAYIELLDKKFQTIKKYRQYTADVAFIEIKNHKLIVYSSNNQIVYYDYETQDLLYTKYIFDKNTEITVLKEGFIDGKGDFEKYVHFIDDKYNVYTINQFYDFFYRPDLVKLKLQGKNISQYTNGLTYQDALKNPPPKIDILKVENQNVTVRKDKSEDVNLSNDKATLSFNIQDNSGGIGLIRIYQEGKLIKTFGDGKINKQAANVDTIAEQDSLNNKAKLAQNEYLEKMQNSVTRGIKELVPLAESVGTVKASNIKNNSGEYSIDLDLISGKNEISIEAFNSSNTVSSYKESINIISNTPKKTPTLYAIVTGVNEFEASYVSNLKYSQNDAKAIKEAIEKEKGKTYKNVEIKYLIGKDLTKENLYKAIDEIKKKAKLEDALVFYISTHGKNYRGKLMLVPQNNKSVRNLISFEDLFKNMQSVKTLKQVFILDTCESGSANDIVSSIYDSKASVLAKSSGVHMLLATTKGTFAFEHPNPNIKHGVFTNNILSALEDRNTDKNKDKKISIIELSKILKEPKYIVKQQYPIIRNIGNDIEVRNLK